MPYSATCFVLICFGSHGVVKSIADGDKQTLQKVPAMIFDSQ